MDYFLVNPNPANELIVIVVTCNLKCRTYSPWIACCKEFLKALKSMCPRLPKR